MRPDLDAMLEYADRLPSLPAAVVKAMELLRDEDSPNDQIAGALSMDQALVGQVMKLANSPYYGVSRRVSTVQQAILVLGRKTVRSLVIGAAAQDFLARPQAGYMLHKGELWSHSMAAGCAASLIAAKVGYKPSEEAFVAGLLHDIGKVVLNGFLADRANKLMRRLSEGDTPFDQVEAELLNVDHASLGGLITERWQLPPKLSQAISFHHRPREAGGAWQLATIVHLADALALSIGVGIGVDGLNYELDSEVAAKLGLTADDLMALADELADKVREPEFA